MLTPAGLARNEETVACGSRFPTMDRTAQKAIRRSEEVIWNASYTMVTVHEMSHSARFFAGVRYFPRTELVFS